MCFSDLGTYTFRILANDTTDNKNHTLTGTFVIRDNLAPNVTNLAPSNGTMFGISSTIEISATIIDNVNVSNASINVTLPNGSIIFSSLNNFTNKYNTSFTISNLTGNYSVRFFANDTNGNVNSTESLYFVAVAATDNDAPNASIVRPANGTIFNLSETVLILANVTDNLSVSSVQVNISKPDGTSDLRTLTLNSTPFYETNFTNTTLVGTYTIRLIATDGSGNVNSTSTAFFIMRDNLAPNVTNMSPVNGSAFNPSSVIEISSIIVDNINVSNTSINVTLPNGSIVFSALNNFSAKYNASFVIPNLSGTYTVRFFANDTDGNVNSTETIFFVGNDTLAPSVVITSPANGTTFNVSIPVLIRANITDISLNLSQVNISKPDGTSELRNLTLNSSPFFETNYSTSLPGIYTFTIIARDTNGNVNGTEMGYFIIGTPPLVIIIAPINETFDDDTKVFITVNASDIDNISTLFANITLPNGTSTLQPVNRSDMTNDSFDSSSRWIPNTESTALGQNCSVDINTTVAGQMNLRINGTGTGVSSTICGFSSTEFIEGDFNATISWNSTIGLGPDSRLLIEFLESTASLATDPREIEIIYKKISNGSTYYVAEYNENGTEVKIAEVQTADTYGQFLITRIENNFTWHTFNNTDQTFDLLATAAEVNVSRGLFTHIEVQSRPPSFASLNVTWDDLTIFSDPYPFIAFNQTTQNGTYAITILANDTFGARNDSTTTHFVITSVNDPPTNPEIPLPQPGTFIRGTFNISWDAVTDLDNDQLQYNITLLNPDLSFNASIVNKTGNTSTVFYLWDSTQYPDGVYNLRVTVFENETVDGLSASDTVDSNFTIDNTRPLVRNLTPTNGTFFNLSDTVTITANITDLNGIDRRLLQALLPNGTLLDFNMSPAGGDLYQFNYTITDVVGNYTMFVVANDSASNENLDI